MFKRDRWTGSDKAPAWMGLLEGIHGLLSRVYRRWYSVVVRRPLPPLHPELLSGHVLSWADRLLDAPGGLSGDEGDEDADNIGDEVHEHEHAVCEFPPSPPCHLPRSQHMLSGLV